MLALIEVSIIGNKIGKAKMAVSVELLLVLEAIAETKVNVPEIPVLPKSKTHIKMLMFSMGLPKSIEKNNKFTRPITNNKIALKISLERIKACGLHKA